jgi:hypothetical protein
MNADTASPTSPAPAPVGGPQPPVPVPGDTSPPIHHEHTKAEPNALLEWSKRAWTGLKEGKVGNPKLLLLVLAVVLILGAWWFLANTSKVNDSALWREFSSALNAGEMKKFAGDPANANSVAAKAVTLNEMRLRKNDAQRKLNAKTLAERQAAADELQKVRDELVTAAGGFTDRTLKAAALLDAAEAEMALIGVPNKDVTAMGLEVKMNSRGQVSKYAELTRKAAEVVGANTDTGKALTAEADKYAKELDADELYKRLGFFHAGFNNPDPVSRTPEPSDPTGGIIPGSDGGPKSPAGLPEGPTKPDDKAAPGDLPKPPVNPFPGDKK